MCRGITKRVPTRAALGVAVSAAALLCAAAPDAVAGPAATPARAEQSTVTAMVPSFDGTPLHVSLVPAAGLAPGHRAPTVILAAGWTGAAEEDPGSVTDPATGVPGVGTLVRAGFNVLSWDPRGFHQSGGTVEFDSPRYEGRDVSALISWLARRPQALLDHPGDPRVGMAGGSYGGAIQLVAAAEDHRIDAIVPDVTYHSLLTSFAPSDTPKTGWIGLFVASGWFAGRLDPLLPEAYGTTAAGRPLTPAEHAFLASRGPGEMVSRVRAPTLLLAGTVDSLFPPSEAVASYRDLRRAHTPVRMLWFCGGHGLCPTAGGSGRLIDRATLAWFDRYLGHQSVGTGAAFEWIDQLGHPHAAAGYPGLAAPPLAGSGRGTLPVGPSGGSGPVPPAPTDSPEMRLIAALSPTPAPVAVSVRLPSPRHAVQLVGAPTLSLAYRGVAVAAAGKATASRVYAQLIDDGEVIGDQVTPIPVRLDGRSHSLTVPLQTIAALARPGDSLTLQLTAACAGFQRQTAVGAIGFSSIRVGVPTVSG